MNPIAEAEVNEIVNMVLAEGINPMTSVALSDVRRLMILAWTRGYTVAYEEGNKALESKVKRLGEINAN